MKREKDRIIDSIINNNQDKKVLLDLLINKNYTIIQEIAKELNTKVQEKEITKTIENNYLTFIASNIIDTDIFNEDMSLKELYSFLRGYESNLVYHLSFDLNYIFNTTMLNKATDKILLVLLSSNNDNANISFTILTRRIKEDTFSYSYLDENNIIKFFIESSLREEKTALNKVINNPEFIKLFESNNISVTSLLEWTGHLKQVRKTIIDTNKFKKAVNTNELVKIAALLSREEVKYAWKNTLIKNRFITQTLRFDCIDKQTQEQILDDPETIKYLPLATIEEFISGFDNKVQLYNSKEMIFLYLDKLNKENIPTAHNIFDVITKFELKNLIEDVYFDYVKEPVVLYLVKNLDEDKIEIICENENIRNQILAIKDVNYFKYLPIELQEQILLDKKVSNDPMFLPLLVSSKSELIAKQFDASEKLYTRFVDYITKDSNLSIEEIANIINNLPPSYYKKLIKEDLFKLNGKTLLSLLSSNIDIARKGILQNPESCIKLIDSINSNNMRDYLFCLSKLTDSERISLITKGTTNNIEVLCATINTLDDTHKQEIYNNKAIREKVLFGSNKYYNMDKYIVDYLLNNEQEITKLSAEKLVDLLLRTNIKENIKILKDKKSLEKIIKSSKKNDGIKNIILNNPSLLSYVITPDNMDFIPKETLVSIIDTLPINDKKYLCQNENVLKAIFGDRVLKVYKNLYEKNNYLFNTLDFAFLDEETINIKFNILEYLTENKDLQRLYVNIRKNLHIGYKFIFTMTSLVNEIDPYALKDILTLLDESLVNKNRNRIGNFEKIFKGVDVDNLTIKEYNKIINYLLYLIPKYNSNSNNHIRKLDKELIPESFSELKVFEKTYDDYYTKKLTNSDQKSYMNNYLLLNYKISLDEAKVLTNRYSLNGIDISKNRDLIFVQKLNNIINNGEYSSKETPLTIVDLFKKDAAIKASYANLLNYEISISTNNLKQQSFKVNGGNIKVSYAKDRFTYLVTRYNLTDLKVNDYYNEWNNYVSSLDTYLKTSIISNDNISSTTKQEILFGFNSIDNNSILRMAPYRLDDNNDLFMCPRSIINNTRETRNNVYIDKIERRLKLKSSTPYIIPDSIIVYKNDLYDENDAIKHSYLELIAKISKDFTNRYHMNGLNIIVIDREFIANNELTKINKNINKYLDNKNVKLYSKIIKKYLNNKSGYILSNSSLAYHFDNKTIVEPLIKRINESTSISELDSLRRLLAEENNKREKVKVNISYEDIDFDKLFKIIDKRKEELMTNKKD